MLLHIPAKPIANQVESANVQQWMLSQQPAHERADAWESQLSSSHLPWVIQEALQGNFDARMQYRFIDDFRFIQCHCDPFRGARAVSEISNTDQAYLCLLYVRKGREKLIIDGKELLLAPGNMMIWNSQSKISFQVLEPFEKISILMPEKVLAGVFPNVVDYTGTIVPDTDPVGATLSSHINTLYNQLDNLHESALAALMRPTMELMAAAFSSYSQISPSTMKHIALGRVKKYIVDNIGEVKLTPSTIAARHNITPRYLHMLFKEEGVSVCNWIKARRVEGSKGDLVRSVVTKESVSEIAYRWGYNDVSQFSRTFKQYTGFSPREFLKQTGVLSRKRLE